MQIWLLLVMTADMLLSGAKKTILTCLPTYEQDISLDKKTPKKDFVGETTSNPK